MQELINIVNEQDKIIGTADIRTVHKKGLLHRAVHIFIINSKGELFCRQRSLKKERYPGYWSTFVGSHVLAGQTYNKVARESLKNTLGIACKLKMIEKERIKDRFENEISATYIGYSDSRMKVNTKQIEGGRFLTINEIKRLAKQKNATPHLMISLHTYLKYREQSTKKSTKRNFKP